MKYQVMTTTVRDTRDFSAFAEELKKQKTAIITSVESLLPQLLRQCDSVAQLRNNPELAAAYGVTAAELNRLHTELVDALTSSVRVRVDGLNEANGKFAIELRFYGNQIAEKLSRRIQKFRTPTDRRLAFLGHLARGAYSYDLTIEINAGDAGQKLLTVATTVENAHRIDFVSELGQQSEEIVQSVSDALWT